MSESWIITLFCVVCLISADVIVDVILCAVRFILIACDGLWKAFSVEDAAKFVIQVLEVSLLSVYITKS